MHYEEVFNTEGVMRFKIIDGEKRVPHTWDDFPSVSTHEIEEWHADGLLHRDGGPARIVRCGYYQSFEDERGTLVAEWYTNGVLTKRVFATDDFKPEPVHVNTRNYDVADYSQEEVSYKRGELERYKVFRDENVVVKVLHSFNGLPSKVVDTRGTTYTFYHKNGVLHQENNIPALSIETDITGGYSHTHYLNGVIHNGELPAMYTSNGLVKFMVYGKLHRAGDEPAYISEEDKVRMWYVDGKLHRAGGKPAVVRDNGDDEYWVDGAQLKKCACTIC